MMPMVSGKFRRKKAQHLAAAKLPFLCETAVHANVIPRYTSTVTAEDG